MFRSLALGITAALTTVALSCQVVPAQAASIPMLVGEGNSASVPIVDKRAPAAYTNPADKPLPYKLTTSVPLLPPKPGDIGDFERVWCENCVAITYDDGPVPNTNNLLDTFAEKGVHATFFLIGGNAAAYPEVVQRMFDEGHEIGNHSYKHPQLPRLSDAGVAKEIDSTNAAIDEAGAPYPVWMRPPYGATNNRVASVVGARGHALALWDVDTSDWKNRNTATTCSIAVARAEAGSVILMHDIHPSTVDAAECIIDGLRAKGLHPVSLAELFEAPESGVTYTRLGSR